jgi:KipI family sensor histidine kinase inhibitor
VSVRLLPCGPNALLAEVADAAEAAALHSWLTASAIDGVRAVVPAARTVLIEVERGTVDAVRHRAAGFAPPSTEPTFAAPTAGLVEIPVVYDGDDLDAVAAARGMTVGEVVRRHSEAVYTAAFCGFAPGFAYLIGGDPELRLPRRAEPRTRVPARSVAIGGHFSAVYPTSSPGGWHLLGHATVDVWDVDRDPPALIAPGSRVRFRPARSKQWH